MSFTIFRLSSRGLLVPGLLLTLTTVSFASGSHKSELEKVKEEISQERPDVDQEVLDKLFQKLSSWYVESKSETIFLPGPHYLPAKGLLVDILRRLPNVQGGIVDLAEFADKSSEDLKKVLTSDKDKKESNAEAGRLVRPFYIFNGLQAIRPKRLVRQEQGKSGQKTIANKQEEETVCWIEECKDPTGVLPFWNLLSGQVFEEGLKETRKKALVLVEMEPSRFSPYYDFEAGSLRVEDLRKAVASVTPDKIRKELLHWFREEQTELLLKSLFLSSTPTRDGWMKLIDVRTASLADQITEAFRKQISHRFRIKFELDNVRELIFKRGVVANHGIDTIDHAIAQLLQILVEFAAVTIREKGEDVFSPSLGPFIAVAKVQTGADGEKQLLLGIRGTGDPIKQVLIEIPQMSFNGASGALTPPSTINDFHFRVAFIRAAKAIYYIVKKSKYPQIVSTLGRGDASHTGRMETADDNEMDTSSRVGLSYLLGSHLLARVAAARFLPSGESGHIEEVRGLVMASHLAFSASKNAAIDLTGESPVPLATFSSEEGSLGQAIPANTYVARTDIVIRETIKDLYAFTDAFGPAIEHLALKLVEEHELTEEDLSNDQELDGLIDSGRLSFNHSETTEAVSCQRILEDPKKSFVKVAEDRSFPKIGF